MSDDDKKIYVGGLPYRHTREDLFEMFEKYGSIEDAFIIRDHDSQRSRGFGFVIFHDKDSMDDAISAMNNTELEGRDLIVEKAGKRRSGGGGGGYRRGGGDGGGYRGRGRDYGRDRDFGRDRDYGRSRDYDSGRDFGRRGGGGYGDDRRGYGGRRDDRY